MVILYTYVSYIALLLHHRAQFLLAFAGIGKPTAWRYDLTMSRKRSQKGL